MKTQIDTFAAVCAMRELAGSLRCLAMADEARPVRMEAMSLAEAADAIVEELDGVVHSPAPLDILNDARARFIVTPTPGRWRVTMTEPPLGYVDGSDLRTVLAKAAEAVQEDLAAALAEVGGVK